MKRATIDEPSVTMRNVSRAAVRYRWLAWLICLPVVWTVYAWIVDRDPPFAVVGAVQATAARAGEATVITASVRRDIARLCGAETRRVFFDSTGLRHDFGEGAYFTAAEVRHQAILMGVDNLRSSVMIPRLAAPGQGMLVMNLAYDCNPVHWMWPIRVTVVVPVEVLP
jgi:hypothetical protein